MSSSRDQSQYGRKRSNTAQSSFRSLPVNPPLKVGDCKVLNAWVHDVKDSSQVVFNQSWWPGVSEGDVLRVLCDPEQPDASFLFIVPKDEGCPKPQLQVRQTCACYHPNLTKVQISIPKPIADAFGLRNHTEVSLVKVRHPAFQRRTEGVTASGRSGCLQRQFCRIHLPGPIPWSE